MDHHHFKSIDELFRNTMAKKWQEIFESYKKDEEGFLREAKITKDENTALHIAILSYNSSEFTKYEESIKVMIKQYMSEEELGIENAKGDTPLHLAATVGWTYICSLIADKSVNLIKKRNKQNETPLFSAAHYGKQDVFICLSLKLKNTELGHSLCRRHDGNTALHSALHIENFELANLIIDYYPNLVHKNNINGKSPLHILANKPAIFKNVTELKYLDSLICKYALVELRQGHANPTTEADQNFGYPSNYRTCVNIFNFIWYPLRQTIIGGRGKGKKDEKGQPGSTTGIGPQDKQHNDPKVEQNNKPGGEVKKDIESQMSGSQESINTGIGSRDKQHNDPKDEQNNKLGKDKGSRGGEVKKDIESQMSGSQESINTGIGSRDKQHNDPKDEQNNKLGKDKGSQGKQKELKLRFFPANYDTIILLLKFAVNIILTVVGVGLGKIKKLEQEKEKHDDALDIIGKMLEGDSTYKYLNDGQEPVKNELTKLSSQRISIPSLLDMDHDPPEQGLGNTDGQEPTSQQKQPLTGAPRDMNSPSEQGHKLRKGDTPFILAAKNGLTGIIKIILKELHIAIYDKDSQGRNAIMLAAKHRQMKVFEYLLDHTSEREFQLLDDESNNIIHLAAMLDEGDKPTRIPGAALQMQWELKWFTYVKNSVPSMCFTHHVNNKGKTPEEIFAETHKGLMNDGNTWLIKTSESCSVIAALIAGSLFATSSSVPGGINEETGRPVLEGEMAFVAFSISSLIGLCLAVTALVFFLAIITSRGAEKDFKNDLPKKLLGGLSCLFVSIVAMLATYCAGHTFVLRDQLKFVEIPIYAFACVPVSLYAFAQLELYADLVRAVCVKRPLSRGRI